MMVVILRMARRRAPYGARGLKCRSTVSVGMRSSSRPVWGAWIEIRRRPPGSRPGARRAPYGARGLKFLVLGQKPPLQVSRPVWGAWIEIRTQFVPRYLGYRRAPYGARGLKYGINHQNHHPYRVAPRMGRVD